jgi:NAD(P)-dependent dehydrogenase (short-subunit alcohol dehydrogenase family)
VDWSSGTEGTRPDTLLPRRRFSGVQAETQADIIGGTAAKAVEDQGSGRKGEDEVGYLVNKTVVIGGVGPGLGRETALAAYREGANVIIAARTAATLDAVAKEVDPDGQRVAKVVADITKEADCRSIIQTALDRFGAIDGIVNCAAMSSGQGGLQSAGDFSEWRDTFDVTVFGTMRLIKLALDALKKTKGSVVMVNAQTWHHPPPSHVQIAYASSKSALTGAMHHLAMELGPDGIRVNEVTPGWMLGPPVERYVQMVAQQRGVGDDIVLQELTARMPLRRMATDGDVAEAIVFFLSDRAGGITGQTLMVNAGEVMH